VINKIGSFFLSWYGVCRHPWYLFTGGLMALSSIFVVGNSLLLQLHGSQIP